MRTVLERFESKYFVAPDGCWLWTASVNAQGYGQFSIDRKSYRAPRVSYELYVGTIPDGLHIDHLCRQPSCVNPHHLEPVTQAENNRRRPYATLCEHGVGISTCEYECSKIYNRNRKREYYSNNSDRVLEWNRNWRERNPKN